MQIYKVTARLLMIQDLSLNALIQSGKTTVKSELIAMQDLLDSIGEPFAQACQIMLACSGKVIVTGMGKSGHIAHKIAATLASTGTPAFYVHPGEACHGDIGMISKQDILLALSYSGETQEILTMLSAVAQYALPVIAITGHPHSSLAQKSKVHLALPVQKEACPLGLAPTTSSTLSLVLGDALAMSLLEARDFTRNDFALSHPGGLIGKKLLMQAKDLMHQGAALPRVTAQATVDEALLVMSQKRLGMTTIVDSDQQTLLGIFTDGDLRRTLAAKHDIHSTQIKQVMSATFQTAPPEMPLAELLDRMRALKITVIPIINEHNHLKGIVHMHDILQEGIR
jgi:arabinose-5-phosphate isomerase